MTTSLSTSTFISPKYVDSEVMAGLFVAMTCPVCQHAATGAMPTDRCVVFYECDTCHTVLRSKPGDANSPPEQRHLASGITEALARCLRPQAACETNGFHGRPMRGFVHVSPPGFRTAAALRVWLSHGERVARQKPPTRTRRRSLPRKTAA